MAERIALWGRDIDHDSSPDPDNGFTGYGYQDPITEPIPVVEDENSGYGYVEAEPEYVDDLTDYADTQEAARAFSYAKPFLDRRSGSAADSPELTSQPAPPPPPPPPPPPAPDTPVYRPQYPPSGGGSGSQAPKPEIGVTRAPLSVAPKPVTAPTSAEVGKHGSNRR